MAEETLATRLARIEAHVEGCILRGSSCEYWSEMHQTKLSWATNKINQATRERDELNKKVEELSDLVVELTTRLNQGESRILSVERVCTIRASDFHTQLYQIQDNQSKFTFNISSTPLHEPASLDTRELVHPSAVQQEGGNPPLSLSLSLLSPRRRPLAPRHPQLPWTGVSAILQSSKSGH